MIPASISVIVKQRHCDDIAYFQEPLNEVHGMLGGWLVDEGGEKKMIGLSVFLTNWNMKYFLEIVGRAPSHQTSQAAQFNYANIGQDWRSI